MDWPLLAGLGEDERRRVLSNARRRRFKSDEVVFHQGDPADTVHLLASGRVALRMVTRLGDVATLEIVGPGAVFGEIALLSEDRHRNVTAVALEPVETMEVGQDVFAELRRAFSSVNRSLIDTLASSVSRLAAERVEAQFVPAETRVLRRLIDLAKVYGGATAGTVITVRQEDLASLAGTSRATVNHVLRGTAKAGVITLSRSRIEIVDAEELTRRAR